MAQSTSDHIARTLETAILEGQFETDARLDEGALSRRFGVSRTPVREALARIALSGLVEQIPHRGTFVRQPGATDLFEMFETMAEMEAACGRLAARRAEPSQIAALAQANDACRRAAEDGEPELYYRENARFHALIYEAAGNAFLRGETARLHRRLSPFRRLQLHLRGRPEESLREHGAILAAIEAGAGPTAAEALRAHVAVQGDRFHRLVALRRSTVARAGVGPAPPPADGAPDAS